MDRHLQRLNRRYHPNQRRNCILRSCHKLHVRSNRLRRNEFGNNHPKILLDMSTVQHLNSYKASKSHHLQPKRNILHSLNKLPPQPQLPDKFFHKRDRRNLDCRCKVQYWNCMYPSRNRLELYHHCLVRGWGTGIYQSKSVPRTKESMRTWKSW